MHRYGIVLLALLGGCFNTCYSGDSCPSSSEVASLDGRLCDEDRDYVCENGTTSCECDPQLGRWRCAPIRMDLSAAPKDLSTPPVGCGAYVACLNNCFDTTVNPSLATCEASCAPSVSGAAILAYLDAVSCAESHCAGALDAGTAACLRAADGTLLNEDGTARSPTDPGTGQKRCNLCLHDATAKLYDEACTAPASADCDPSACAATVEACLQD